MFPLATLDRTIGGKRHTVNVELSLVPLDQSQREGSAQVSTLEVHLDIDKDSIKASGYSREELLNAVTAGVETACVQGISLALEYLNKIASTHQVVVNLLGYSLYIIYSYTDLVTRHEIIVCIANLHFNSFHYMHAGPLLAFPVQNVQVSVNSLTLGGVTSLPVLSSCVADGVTKALREAEVQLLEPCTNVVVTVPEEHLGTVLSDLSSQRRGKVKEVASLLDSREVTAITPLACLMVRGSMYSCIYE